MHSRFASSINCPYCGRPNSVSSWPPNGDYAAFYCQTKENTEKTPGVYRVPVNCRHCKKDWFVVWDEDPR